MSKFLNITELSKTLDLVDTKTKKPLNHIIRYWEKEFKQIQPTILKKRRYYTEKQVNLMKLIKYLLKEKGLKISGVKTILKNRINSLDDYHAHSLKADYYKKRVKLKSKNLLDKLRKIKSYGKKKHILKYD